MNMDHYNEKHKSKHLKSIREVVSNIVINTKQSQEYICKLVFRAFRVNQKYLSLQNLINFADVSNDVLY